MPTPPDPGVRGPATRQSDGAARPQRLPNTPSLTTAAHPLQGQLDLPLVEPDRRLSAGQLDLPLVEPDRRLSASRRRPRPTAGRAARQLRLPLGEPATTHTHTQLPNRKAH